MTNKHLQLTPAGLGVFSVLTIDTTLDFAFPSGTDLSGHTVRWVVPAAANSPYTGTINGLDVSLVIPAADSDLISRGKTKHYVVQNNGTKDIIIMMGEITLVS